MLLLGFAIRVTTSCLLPVGRSTPVELLRWLVLVPPDVLESFASASVFRLVHFHLFVFLVYFMNIIVTPGEN